MIFVVRCDTCSTASVWSRGLPSVIVRTTTLTIRTAQRIWKQMWNKGTISCWCDMYLNWKWPNFVTPFLQNITCFVYQTQKPEIDPGLKQVLRTKQQQQQRGTLPHPFTTPLHTHITAHINCYNNTYATEAHLGSGELLRAASLREVVRESKARSQRFLLYCFYLSTEDTQVTGCDLKLLSLLSRLLARAA